MRGPGCWFRDNSDYGHEQNYHESDSQAHCCSRKGRLIVVMRNNSEEEANENNLP